jgi:hypothetical protein
MAKRLTGLLSSMPRGALVRREPDWLSLVRPTLPASPKQGCRGKVSHAYSVTIGVLDLGTQTHASCLCPPPLPYTTARQALDNVAGLAARLMSPDGVTAMGENGWDAAVKTLT